MNEVLLTCTRSVLELDEDYSVFYTKLKLFQSPDEDTGQMRRGLFLSFADWKDMGKPETITVTVEPGDQLNP